jgi:hypothetical protein
MMRAIGSSETLVLTRATRRNISWEGILHSCRRQNLKSYTAISETIGWREVWEGDITFITWCCKLEFTQHLSFVRAFLNIWGLKLDVYLQSYSHQFALLNNLRDQDLRLANLTPPHHPPHTQWQCWIGTWRRPKHSLAQFNTWLRTEPVLTAINISACSHIRYVLSGYCYSRTSHWQLKITYSSMRYVRVGLITLLE